MKTPTYALVMRATAAVAIALAGSTLAVPALAESGSPDPAAASPSPSTSASPEATASAPAPSAEPSPSPQPGISDAGLADAVQRDLGMTMEEFDAAGALAKRAADAVPSLRGLPGYVGIVLRDGRIVVQGSGAELRTRIDELNQPGPALFTLEAPAARTLEAPAGTAASPAAAPKPELVAGSAEQLFQAYLREVGPAGLQAVAFTDGHFVIRTGGTNTAEGSAAVAALAPRGLEPVAEPAPGKISAADFVSRYANVELEKGAAIKTEEDYYGGQGYVVDNMTICSAGFGAFSPSGLPLVLTAGHCAEDGTAVKADVEPLSAAPAGGSTTPRPDVLESLGTFGFSQFGGTNNSPITGSESSPGNVGTDIAVINELRPGLTVQSSAITWNNMASPAKTSVKIIGTAAPYQGQAVCRSGRSTGWSCGKVAETGIYVVGGRTAAAGDLRAFKGFLSYDVQSGGGDSGGPWISGNFAVGTHSAGEPRGAAQNFAVATTLEDALGYVPGPVQLQLFLNKPELAGTPDAGTVSPGSLVRGRVPAAPASGVAANSLVRLVRPNQDAVELPVDDAGNWSFNAPSSEGAFQFTAETVNGYSRSGATTFSLSVSELPAPVITTPGSTPAALDRIVGTGTPGNVVKLSGDLSGSATVTPAGQWSVPVGSQPAYGKLSVTAVQTAPGHVDSPPATMAFTVPPPAPAVAGHWNGLSFPQDGLPDAISGTGIEGAAVTVSIDGRPIGGVQQGGSGVGTKAVFPSLFPHVLVADGRWSVRFPAGLAVGPHTLSVTQSLDSIASSPVAARFSIAPAAMAANASPTAAAVEVPAAAPMQPVAPAMLASTGADGVVTTAAVGAAAMLLGAACVALGRRRPVR